jgi:hypothetical protein
MSLLFARLIRHNGFAKSSGCNKIFLKNFSFINNIHPARKGEPSLQAGALAGNFTIDNLKITGSMAAVPFEMC